MQFLTAIKFLAFNTVDTTSVAWGICATNAYSNRINKSVNVHTLCFWCREWRNFPVPHLLHVAYLRHIHIEIIFAACNRQYLIPPIGSVLIITFVGWLLMQLNMRTDAVPRGPRCGKGVFHAPPNIVSYPYRSGFPTDCLRQGSCSFNHV